MDVLCTQEVKISKILPNRKLWTSAAVHKFYIHSRKIANAHYIPFSSVYILKMVRERSKVRIIALIRHAFIHAHSRVRPLNVASKKLSKTSKVRRVLSLRHKHSLVQSCKKKECVSALMLLTRGSQNAKKSSFSFTVRPPHVYIRMHSRRDRVRQKLKFLICQGGSVHLFQQRISKNSADDHYVESNNISISETKRFKKVHDKTYSMYTDP